MFIPQEKRNDNKVSGSLDIESARRTHVPHKTGSGKHKDKRRKERQQERVILKKEIKEN